MNKATEEATATVTNDRQKTGSVIGGFRGKLPSSKKRIVIAVIGVTVVLVSLAGYGVYRQLNPSVQDAVGASPTNTDFYTMSLEEVRSNIKPILGMTENELRTKSLSSRKLSTYEKSYGAAAALVMLGEHKKSIEAFTIAESQLSSAKLDDLQIAAFHYDYAINARQAGDINRTKEQIKLSRQVLDKSKAGNDLKAAEYDKLKYLERELDT